MKMTLSVFHKIHLGKLKVNQMGFDHEGYKKHYNGDAFGFFASKKYRVFL